MCKERKVSAHQSMLDDSLLPCFLLFATTLSWGEPDLVLGPSQRARFRRREG